MGSKAKSGLSATRQYFDRIDSPPNAFTVGQVNYSTRVQDGKGHAVLHASVANQTAGTLRVLQSNRVAGPFVIVASRATFADVNSGKQVMEIVVPITRQFVQVTFVGTCQADFELQAYFDPRADSPALFLDTDGNLKSSMVSGGGGGGAFAQGNFDSANVDETTATAGWVRAAVTGRNQNLGATTQNVPVEARLVSGIDQFVTTTPNALFVAAMVTGIDNTGASVTRSVEARSLANFSNITNVLNALLTVAVPYGLDALSGTFKNNLSLSEITLGNSIPGHYEVRQNGYWSSARQRRFASKHATEGANLTAQATYVATTPTLLFSSNAALVRTILRTLYIGIDSATTNPVRIVIKIDSANRLSAGGTTVTPQNENSAGGASGITALTENATATAEGGGTKRLYEFLVASGKAASIFLNFNDEIIVGLTGSILIYVFDDAGSAGPVIVWDTDHEEAA